MKHTSLEELVVVTGATFAVACIIWGVDPVVDAARDGLHIAITIATTVTDALRRGLPWA